MANYLIIAASSGMAQATTALLLSEGHRVLTTARSDQKIKPDYILDAANFSATCEVVSDAQSKLGQLDGIASFSGSLLLRPAHQTPQEQFEEVIKASLTAAFAATHAAGKLMTSGGSVVLFSSAAALEGLPNHEAIAAAKAGVQGLVQSAAATYAPQNLRFNAIAPGLTQTPLTQALTSSEAARKMSEAMHPLGRLGTPADIANVVSFFLNPANSWITGQVLAVDGGLSRLKMKVKV